MKVLFLIVARGGSRAIKDKNLREIAGLSLIGYKAVTARKSRYCSRLIISTDSPAIQAEASRYGVEVPFTRPAELATDTAATVDVIRHAMDWIEREEPERYEALMLLEPTTPFATASDYDNAVTMMELKAASVVVGMREMEVHSSLVGPMDRDLRLTQIIDQIGNRSAFNRQTEAKEYTMNGALYLIRWDYFRQSGRIYGDRDNTYGYLMDRYHSIDIDEQIDLSWAQLLVDQGFVDRGPFKAD